MMHAPLQDQMLRLSCLRWGYDGVRWGFPAKDQRCMHPIEITPLRVQMLRHTSCAAGDIQPNPCLSFLQPTEINTKTETKIDDISFALQIDVTGFVELRRSIGSRIRC